MTGVRYPAPYGIERETTFVPSKKGPRTEDTCVVEQKKRGTARSNDALKEHGAVQQDVSSRQSAGPRRPAARAAHSCGVLP